MRVIWAGDALTPSVWRSLFPLVLHTDQNVRDRYRGRSQQMKDHWLRDHSHRGPYPMGYKFPSLQEVCDANNIDKEDVLPFDSPLKLRTRSETVLHKYIIGKMMPHFHGSLSGLNKTLKKSRPKTPKTETTPEESRGATPIAESLMGCGQIGWEIPQPLFASLESTTVAPLTLEHLEWPFQVPPISSSTLPPFPNNTRDFGLGVDPVEYYNTKPFYAPQPSSVDFDILFNIQPNSNGLPFSPIIDEDWGWLASVSQPKA